MKSYIAELVGTCLLTLVLILATIANPWVATIFAVFTLIFLSYTIGHVSGCHVNPAITLGAMMVKRISPKRALFYVISQLAGAALAILFVKWIGAEIQQAAAMPLNWKLFSAELVGTIVFGFGVAAVAFRRVERGPSGFVVGLSLFGGIALSSLMLGGAQGAILNPAVAFGLNVMSFESLLAPIIGAIIGMWLYVLVSEDAKATGRQVLKMFKSSDEGVDGAHIA